MKNKLYKNGMSVGLIILLIGAGVSVGEKIVNIGNETLSEDPIDDSFTAQHNPDENYGTRDTINIRPDDNGPGGWAVHGYIKFVMTGISNVESAKLRLYFIQKWGHDPAGRAISIYRVTSDWNEETITWNNKPSSPSTATDYSTVPNSVNQWMEWDVTSDVQYFIAHPNENFGWKLSDDVIWIGTDCPETIYASKEHANTGFHPLLDINNIENIDITISYPKLYHINWENLPIAPPSEIRDILELFSLGIVLDDKFYIRADVISGQPDKVIFNIKSISGFIDLSYPDLDPPFQVSFVVPPGLYKISATAYDSAGVAKDSESLQWFIYFPM